MRRIIKYIGIESSPDQFKLLGTGREGIVWLKENQVLKFSLNGSNEIELLKKIMNCNNGRLKNVINITGHIKNPENDLDILVLEYVKGQSLLNIISKQNIFYQKASDAMKIGKDLLNGLKEVRRADIYHRDIKPANILIEYGTNRAILMDLGISTENSIETINGNKGYGGNNDLISIGQVIYETYTGKNLFNDKPTFLCQTLTKDNIVTERTKAYDDPKKLKEIFEKVSDNIPGTLGKLIVQLLDDDLWTQPNLEKVNKLYEIFEKFTEEQLLFDF